MSAQLDTTTCLDIPVPLSLRRLVSAPPVCHPSQGDIETIEILQNLGKKLQRPANEIAQACNLASGLSDIVIILERPREKHNFNDSFAEFVKGCATLQAVDELIRLATKGARSIHTVSVLDVFSFQWNKKDTSNDEACQSVLAQILKAKKPRVVLCCHTSYSYENEVLKCLEVKVKNYGLHRKKVVFAEGHETDLLQSFHPGCVRNTECRPEFRALLIHHFVAAFSVLSDEFAFPDYVEAIRELCDRKGNRVRKQIPSLEDAEAADFISKALQGKYEDAQIKPDYPGFAYDTKGEMESFDEMFASFQRLLESGTNTFGTLGIALIITLYWNEHFEDDPTKEQLRYWLLIRGSEQEDWLPSPGHSETRNSHDPLKVDEITSLEYSLSKMSFAPPSDSTLQEMRSINDGITHLTSAFLASIRFELVAGTMPDNLKNLVYRQKCLIEGYIKQSPVANISNTLRIWRLMQRCEFLADMVANSIADSKECERVLKDLLASVKQLTPILQSSSV